jgi:hypothetical protein
MKILPQAGLAVVPEAVLQLHQPVEHARARSSVWSAVDQHLWELISGKTVTLDCENERSYGRLFCKILLPRVRMVRE